MDTYCTISTAGEAIYTEKRSKFLAFAEHVPNEEAVKTRIAQLRKQFYDARHVCYAYVLGYGGDVTHANDDGEPSGTAGRPILGQIRSANLTYTLVVVVRYFGGIKLGVGGLVQAYKTTAQLTLQEAEIEERLITETLILTFDYPLMNKVMRVVKEQNLTITTQHLTEQCELHLAIRTTDYPRVKEIFQNIYGVKVAD